jgi:SPP1 gp7 family putative phage head morphogenesis protein
MLRDLAPRAAREEWAAARRADVQYGIQLRKIARHVGDLIRHFDLYNEHDAAMLSEALQRYAAILTPWAKSAARRMVAEVAARSDQQWRRVAAEMGSNFRELFGNDDQIGIRYRQLQAEQVALITSIPRDAALRVHELIRNGVLEGKRFTEIVPAIQRGGEVSKSKATLIARTETGRVVSNLTQARAESVGSTKYMWHTVHDAQVRPSHRKMDGQIVEWAKPPTLDGMTFHAGAGPNCRCWSEPLLALDLGRTGVDRASVRDQPFRMRNRSVLAGMECS